MNDFEKCKLKILAEVKPMIESLTLQQREIIKEHELLEQSLKIYTKHSTQALDKANEMDKSFIEKHDSLNDKIEVKNDELNEKIDGIWVRVFFAILGGTLLSNVILIGSFFIIRKMFLP